MREEGGSCQHIVLAGGGHAHVIVLGMLASDPIAGTKITLVSDVTHATCTSMLAGVVAGKYGLNEVMIDLRGLCESAGAEFVQGKVSGLNLTERLLLLDRGSTISFRLLSFNTGTRPAFSEEPSVSAHAWPLKPIEIFLSRLEEFVAHHEEGETKTVVIVGGGKEAVEIACALRERLRSDAIIHIIHSCGRFLGDYRQKTSEAMFRLLERRRIVIHLEEFVTEVSDHSVVCESGLEIPADVVIWAAHPEPSLKWLGNAGLAVDNKGFMLIRNTLQSASHTFIFGAGEITSMQGLICPRTSRMSMLQGPVLFTNLKRWIEGARLKTFECSNAGRDFIFTGTGTTLVQTGRIVVNSRIGSMVRRILDRSFVEKYSAPGK